MPTMTRKTALLVLVLGLAVLGGTASRSAEISPPQNVRLGTVPPDADIVLILPKGPIQDIFVMKENGEGLTQITFNSTRGHYEHVAVSPDRKRIAVTYPIRDQRGRRSVLRLLDLEQGTDSQLVPEFYSAGGGGVDWDRDGFVYFSALPQAPSAGTLPAVDVYRIKYDGTGLTQLTNSRELEGDVSVSDDGTMMTYVKAVPAPGGAHTEIWVSNSDGSNPRLVYRAGKVRESSAHDPELSPDNGAVVFSQVNPNFKNFAGKRGLDTAHDLIVANVDGSGVRRVTPEGGIQIVPDWRGDKIIYIDINEADGYTGMAMVDATGQNRRRFGPPDGRSPKWIPLPDGADRAAN